MSPDLQGIGQHFGIGMRLEADAEVFHFAAQRRVIVDLAVERHRESAIERNLRLGAVLGIDDAQASRAHGDIRQR